jgi:DNA-binding NarL/FixJ family response regulator
MPTRIASHAAQHIGAATGLRLRGGTDDSPRIGCNDLPMSETVVIVDDNEGFRAQARLLLTYDGYDVIGEAGNGASGLESVRRLRPNIALLDAQLPDVDGFSVARGVRDHVRQTAVVIISTRDATDYGSAVTTCGACGFIAKAELCGDALRAILEVPA